MTKKLFPPESAARVKAEILRLLETPRTRKEIAEALGYKPRQLDNLFGELRRASLITHVGKDRNDPLWRLTSDQQRIDAIFSDAEHHAWMEYWALPRAQRQKTAPPTWRAHHGMQ